MAFEIETEADITRVADLAEVLGASPNGQAAESRNGHRCHSAAPATTMSTPRPEILSATKLMELKLQPPEQLIEGLLAKHGATLVIGSPKAGKTILTMQFAISVASGKALFGKYQVLDPGPVHLVEQDDPGATASIQEILKHSQIRDVKDIPFFLTPRVPFTFGPELLEWLEEQIKNLKLRMLILDSYTALRPARKGGGDIVKIEHGELSQLNELGKRTSCAVLVIHHGSKSSAKADWSEQGAGTYAMNAAAEGQIHISRFLDLESSALERLVRIRGRHIGDTEFVLRFRKETVGYEHVLEGGAAELYPFLLQLQAVFGTQSFSPKTLSYETGVSRATASRQIERLSRAGVISKRSFGEYAVNR